MRHSYSYSILILMLAIILFPSWGRAACLSTSREVAFESGSTRMKAYSCSLDDGGAPALQIEFDRLSEAAAGNLLEGASDKDQRNLYGPRWILQNKVYKDAKTLFDKFGTRTLVGDCFFIYEMTSAETGGKATQGKNGQDGCDNRREIWYLTNPDLEHQTTMGYPASWQPKIVNHRWPKGWNFFYLPSVNDGAGSGALVSTTMLWRPVTGNDLMNYDADMLRSNSEAGIAAQPEGGGDALKPKANKYMLLMNYVTRGDVPDDFLTLAIVDAVGCGCGAGGGADGIHIRQLVMHTAFVKNISNSPITIDALLEGEDESELLRPYSDGQPPRDYRDLTINPVSLAPNQTLAIPLRIKFVPAESVYSAFRNVAGANSSYQRISNFPAAMLSTDPQCPVKYTIQRDSFGQPTAPAPRLYSYGPAVTLKGLTVSGRPIKFDNPLSNFLQLSVGGMYGSCPYVYAYDNSEHNWVRHGKIIDSASSPQKETTQRLEIGGLATRFKISEEEQELTYIRNVQLELSFEDGHIAVLFPVNSSPRDIADPFERIEYGASREYLFEAPKEEKTNVVKSTLIVTGYYMRYTDLVAIRNAAKER